MRSRVRNKEVSWLSFNARVLQEAANPQNPLLERIKFLGIFSSNMDEFFRVRVATLSRLGDLGPEAKALIGHDPRKILKRVQKIVLDLTEEFDAVYARILDDLRKHKVFIINEKELSLQQGEIVKNFFREVVRSKLIPIMLDDPERFPDMRDESIYLAVCLKKKHIDAPTKHALIEVPTDWVSRFFVLPKVLRKQYIIILDDAIRYNLKDIFSPLDYDDFSAYTVKLTRDSELDLDNDLSQSYIKKMARSVKQRKEGSPVRFIYDAEMPRSFLNFFIKHLHLDSEDTIIPGARYHNFKDFMKFPDFGEDSWKNVKSLPLPHPDLANQKSVMAAIEQRDILLHYPYHPFAYFIDLLREASIDPEVESIKITLYRVAKYSSVINALINAVKNGKSVTVILELQARFDEEANIHWANKMQEAGVRVIFGVPGLKVHSKLFLITRKKRSGHQLFAAVGTGNFNEDTARLYSDHTLFTADKRLTKEVEKIFTFFETNYQVTVFKHLIVSPFNLRKKITHLIKKEIDNAKAGKEAQIFIKCNNLVDASLIKQLYKASEAGVQVRLIVRSMFALIPGVQGMSENIEAISIVDRYLEHSRIYMFQNGGENRLFITSADLMTRNIDHRVEVTCPIYDESLKEELIAFLEMQWKDNTRARILDEHLKNEFRMNQYIEDVRFQYDFYDVLQQIAEDHLAKRDAKADTSEGVEYSP